MNQFKTLYGKPIPDIVEYIKNYISTKENVKILIGSDSQCYNNTKTVYGVVIALYTTGKGAHVLCTRETKPMEKDLYNRLMTEVWKSIELAEYLRENGIPKAEYIDIDLNPDKKYKSNIALRQAVGFVEGMGYQVRCKSMGAIMTYAANYLVRV